MKKTLFNLTKKDALTQTTVEHTLVANKVKVADVNKLLAKETLYPMTKEDEFDGLGTARTNAILWLSELGKVKRYKDGYCAKQGRKKICEVYLVSEDGRVHVYADSDMIKAWSREYKGFLTQTEKWSRFEFLYGEWLRFTDKELYNL